MRNVNPIEFGEVNRRGGVTYYHQLYTLLMTALADGSIPAGSALPSETELMARFQVSRNTVRRALERLEKEKRIIRRRGSGSYARNNPHAEVSPDVIAAVLQNDAAAEAQTSIRLLQVQSVPTPEFIRRRDPLFGDTSLMVRRCRSFKGEPFMLNTSHVPEHLAGRLTRRHVTRQATLTALHELGATPAFAEQTITALSADAVAARYLGVEAASPLLCVHRLVRDKEGRSIEHHSCLYRPDRCDLRSGLSLESSASGIQWSLAQPQYQAQALL